MCSVPPACTHRICLDQHGRSHLNFDVSYSSALIPQYCFLIVHIKNVLHFQIVFRVTKDWHVLRLQWVWFTLSTVVVLCSRLSQIELIVRAVSGIEDGCPKKIQHLLRRTTWSLNFYSWNNLYGALDIVFWTIFFSRSYSYVCLNISSSRRHLPRHSSPR